MQVQQVDVSRILGDKSPWAPEHLVLLSLEGAM